MFGRHPACSRLRLMPSPYSDTMTLAEVTEKGLIGLRGRRANTRHPDPWDPTLSPFLPSLALKPTRDVRYLKNSSSFNKRAKGKNPSLLFSENILVDGSNIESWFSIGLQPALPVPRAVVFRCILPLFVINISGTLIIFGKVNCWNLIYCQLSGENAKELKSAFWIHILLFG